MPVLIHSLWYKLKEKRRKLVPIIFIYSLYLSFTAIVCIFNYFFLFFSGYGGGGRGGGGGNQSGASLRKPRWDMESLSRFEKDFYREHPNVQARSMVISIL